MNNIFNQFIKISVERVGKNIGDEVKCARDVTSPKGECVLKEDCSKCLIEKEGKFV